MNHPSYRDRLSQEASRTQPILKKTTKSSQLENRFLVIPFPSLKGLRNDGEIFKSEGVDVLAISQKVG